MHMCVYVNQLLNLCACVSNVIAKFVFHHSPFIVVVLNKSFRLFVYGSVPSFENRLRGNKNSELIFYGYFNAIVFTHTQTSMIAHTECARITTSTRK